MYLEKPVKKGVRRKTSHWLTDYSSCSIYAKPGWPQTWKTQGELKEFQKLSKISGKTQGNFEFLQKNLENSGKM